MPERGEHDWGEDRGSRRGRDGLIVIAFASAARALEAETDRWFLWIPVLFAGGIVTYFTLQAEPDPRIALALVVGALGLALTLRTAPLGLAIGGASLAFALGFADAKLRTEMARAPVLAHELRYVSVTGFIENHELRDRGRARLTLRVTALGEIKPAELPYRVRVTLPAKGNPINKTGALVTLKATLQPPPEPVEPPGGFDFGRQAWFARLGATAAVPTVRSWIMMSIVLIAVMLDRPALTMRNVALAALAALAILIVAPESLFDPSFEMSFAAVVALVALFEWLARRERDGLADVSPFWRSLRKGWAIVAGAALTTLVASTAIAPFAVYHFHRMTEYGLIANLLAAPIVSLLIMPMALLSLTAMPFGREAWPLKAMGFGIDAMV